MSQKTYFLSKKKIYIFFDFDQKNMFKKYKFLKQKETITRLGEPRPHADGWRNTLLTPTQHLKVCNLRNS